MRPRLRRRFDSTKPTELAFCALLTSVPTRAWEKAQVWARRSNQLPVGLLARTPPSTRPKRGGLGVGEPVGAGLVLKGGRPLFARRLLFTSQCSLPGLPRVKRPSFAFALRSGEGHTAMQRSFWASSKDSRSVWRRHPPGGPEPRLPSRRRSGSFICSSTPWTEGARQT